LRLALCGHRKFRQASCNPFTWRREASTSRLPTLMLGPETVTRLTGRLAPRTTHPTTHHPHTRRVMCHRGRYTEHPHSMKDIDQRTRRVRPTLTSPTCMRKAFRRGRLPLYRTTAGRIVDSIQPMAGRDTVTNTCDDKGRFGGGPSFVAVAAIRLPIAACAAIFKSDVMTGVGQWPGFPRRHSLGE
jgi:hypothetical protein